MANRQLDLMLRTAAAVALLLVMPLPSAGRDLSGTGHAAHRINTTDQLIVRARGGLHPSFQQQLLADQGAEPVGRIDALEASIIRVPHARVLSVVKALRQSGYFKSVERDATASIAETPSDPQFASEWGVIKIGAPTAWDTTMGSRTVIVAIVDSGIDPNHPDLRDQLVPGYDFVNNDADPSDDHGHGTRMAGVVAADALNRFGVVGVAPNCKLLPVKVLGADGNGAYSTIAAGITYAADHGARVINLSLGGTASSPLLQSAVDYAAARGAVVVASAGNFGTGAPVYPAAYSNAVAVGATDQNDVIASFSSYGSSLALAAPGVNIITTNRTGARGALYVGSSGTSPAAAFVSGAFALLLSAHPGLSNADAVAVMTGGAHDLGSAGWDAYYGSGRVDIARAIGAPNAPNAESTPAPVPAPTAPSAPSNTTHDRRAPSVSIASPPNNAAVSGNTIVGVSATDDVGVTMVELLVDGRVAATDSAPPFSFVWDTTTTTSGTHLLSARAHDAAGHQQVSRSVRVTVGQAAAASTRAHH